MNLNICNNCGGDYTYRNGRWICQSCGAYKPEEISNEEVTLLYTASQALRLADFDIAERDFDDIIHKYPQNPNGYWGRLMAKYGIKYEDDYDGRKIPTCYATSIESLSSDPDYQKALQFADPETKAYYKQQVEYIERVRKEWVEKARKEKPYDIFICYKDSDLANGIERTQDSIAAQDLYIHLTNKGYRVFYSHESLRDKVGEKYEPYIFSALSTAKVMLVYGSKSEYITSTWLKNEWTRYEQRIKLGEKHPESLLVACDGFSPAELPKILSSRQCFDASRRSFYGDLDDTIDRILKQKKKVAPPPPAPRADKAKKKSRAPLIVALTLLIAASAAIGGYALLGQKEPNVPTPDESKVGTSTQAVGSDDTSQSPGIIDPADSTSAGTDSAGNTPVINQPVDTTPVEPPFPSFNFNGEEITVISRTQAGEFVTETWSDMLSNAMYQRDQEAEANLNVKLKHVFETSLDGSEIFQKLATAVASGNSDYDIVATPAYTTASESLNGTFLNLREISNLDLSKTCWNQNYNETMTYRDAQFSATGDLFLLGDYAFATVYNRRLIEKVYQSEGMIALLVENGTWTLDTQASMIPILYQNLNAADTPQENIVYSFISSPSLNADAYWSSCDVPFIDSAEFSYVLGLEKLTELTEKLLTLFNNTEGTGVLSQKENYAEQSDIELKFLGGNAAMASLRFMNIRKLTPKDVGIAPMPKFNESQANYRTPLDFQFSVATIPSTVLTARLDMVGATLNALCHFSTDTVQDRYDDDCMRSAVSENDYRILELIRENFVFDAGYLYANSLDNFSLCLRNFIRGNNNSVAAYVQAQQTILKMNIESIRNKLESMAG